MKTGISEYFDSTQAYSANFNIHSKRMRKHHSSFRQRMKMKTRRRVASLFEYLRLGLQTPSVFEIKMRLTTQLISHNGPFQ